MLRQPQAPQDEGGTLLNSVYTTTGGGPTNRYNNFRQVLSINPCPAG